MKLLVTGGAGFIGSNFIFYMLKKYPKYEIICLDALTYAGNLKTIENILKFPNFNFLKGNITDCKLVFDLFEKENIDIVVNFAAETHVDSSIINPHIFLDTNIIGTQVLMDACREFKVKRFHQISTDEVYGDFPIDRANVFFNEESPLRPSNPYAVSKASADLLVLSYYRTYKLPVTISRCTNNYGPYHFPEKLIPLMIIKMLRDEYLPVYGDGRNIRDWLYVEDHCTAIDKILKKGKEGEIYNICGYNEMSNIDVVKILLKEFKKSEDYIKYVDDRAGHDQRYAINSRKITQELDWLPNVNFSDGVKKTIKWYIDNTDWWESVLKDFEQAKKI
jgi:dTDP-glucose 4,6-dehydratase